MIGFDENNNVWDSIDVAMNVCRIVHIHFIDKSCPCDCILLMILDSFNEKMTALILAIKDIANKEMVE